MIYGTPLCPAGHLPPKGGDHSTCLFSPLSCVDREATTFQLLISPLGGEMAGRPEGGA